MVWQFPFHLIPLLFSLFILIYMLQYAWRRRSAPGMKAFGTVVAAVLFWTASYTLEIASVPLSTKIFWAKVQYLGILATPAFWLIFMLRYTKRDHMVNMRNMILLFAPILFFLTLAWTNEQHHLIWAQTHLDVTGVFREPVFGQGFWFLIAYLYITTLLASLALLNSLSRSPGVYRRQGAMLLVATFTPMIASLMTVSGLNPLAPLDLTPMSFIISGAAWLYGRTRLQLMDILPVARAALVEKLADGVLVLDAQNRVLDLNGAAQRFLGLTGQQAISRDLGQLLPPVVAQLPAPDNTADAHLELNLADGKTFDAHLIALRNNDGEFYGRILTLYNISASKQTQAELRRYSEQARQQTEQMRRRERYLMRLNEITRTAVSQLDSQTMLQTLADSLLGFEDADNCFLTLYDETKRLAKLTAVSGQDRLSFTAVQAKPGQVLLVESVLNAGEPLAIPDVRQTPYVSPEIAAMFPSRSVLALPLTIGSQKLGTAVISYNQPHQFTEDEVQYGAQAAAQISLALHKAQLLEQEREQRQLAELLQETGAVLSATLDERGLLDRLLNQVGRLVPFDMGAVLLVDDGRVHIASHHGFDRLGKSVISELETISFDLSQTHHLARMAATGRPFAIPDVTQYPGWVKTRLSAQVRSWVGAPIIIEGETVAYFSIDKIEPDFYGEKHKVLLTALANQSALALQNARLYESTRRQLAELVTLHQIAAVGNEAMSLDELVDQVTEIITETFYPDNFGFLFLDKDTGYLHPHFSYRVQRKHTDLISVPPDAGLIGRVIGSGRPVRVDNVRQDEAYLQADPRTRAEICVPLKVNQRVIGVINAESPEVGVFSAEDERFLLTLARQLSTAIEKIQLLESERARRQEEERLRAAISNLSGTLELEQVLDSILIQVERVVPFDSAAVFLVQGDQVCLVAGRGFPDEIDVVGTSYPRTNPLFAVIEETKQPTYLADAQADARFGSWGGATYIHGWLGAPLISHGIVIGMLTLDSRATDVYGDTEAVLVQAFAQQAAAAIENARLYEAEQHARNLADTLRAANQALTQSLDPHQVGDSLLDYLQQLIPYDSAALMLLQPHNRVILHNVRGFDQFTDETAVQSFIFDLDKNLSMQMVINNKQSLLIPDTQEYERWEYRRETSYIRSWLGVPLISGGKPIGLFSLDKAEPNFFTETHRQLAASLAAQTAVALQNAQFFNETRRRAEELTLASDILLGLNATPDVTEVFPQIANNLRQITQCERATLTLIDAQRQEGVMMILDRPRQTYGKGVPVQLTESAAAGDILAGRVHITNDLNDEIEFTDARLFIQAGYRSRINIPLLVGKGVAGSLNLAWKISNGPDPAQVPLLKQIASAVALAMERGRLFDALNRQARQLGILNQLSQQVTSQLDSRELYTTVVRTLRIALDYPRMSIFTVEPDANIVSLRALVGPDNQVQWPGEDEYQQKFGEGIIGQAAATGEKILVNDTRTYPNFLASQIFPVRSELALPLKVGDQVIGVLNVDSDEYHSFDAGDVTILSVVADQLAVSLEKARLFEETRQQTKELETVAEISASLRAANSVKAIAETLLSQVGFEGQTVRAVFLLDPESEMLMARGSLPSIPGFSGAVHRLGEGITGQVALTGKAHISEKLANDPAASFSPEEKKILASVYGSVALPLRAEEQIVGVLHVAWLVPRQFTLDEVRLLTAVCEIAGNALHRAQLMDTLEQRVNERTRELAEAYTQLQELDQLKSRFVADVSHELRTPITNVKLYLDLLAHGNEDRREHYLSVLNRQADRLVNLLEDILNLSRLDLGGGQVEMTQVNFNALVQQVITVHEPRLEAASLELKMDLQADLPLMTGERNQLSQVVTNLLVNAINYTPAGGIRVKTYMVDGRNQICLEISDTGIGIADEDRAYLFDRFYRGKHASQSNIPGTGLGLAIVKEIVELHGGQIEFHSQSGQGTLFRVIFPSSGDVEDDAGS